jgi:hypothetical protein
MLSLKATNSIYSINGKTFFAKSNFFPAKISRLFQNTKEKFGGKNLLCKGTKSSINLAHNCNFVLQF